MGLVMRNFRIEKELWNRIPDKNKSRFVRQLLEDYLQNNLVKDNEILGIEKENRLLHDLVEELRKDKEQLRKDLEYYKGLFLPKPSFWGRLRGVWRSPDTKNGR